MRPVASVLLILRTREGARATLEALWSEVPAAPVEVLVHATGPALEVARREHARRARVVGEGEAPAGAALLGLVLASRARVLLALAEGARPTPGWARELVAVALGEAPGLALRPGLAAPRLVAPGALAGPQAPPDLDDPEALDGSRAALRALADRVRFDERRAEDLAAVDASAACLAVPRAVLERIGLPDPRRASPGGALACLQRRARAAGAPVRLARRALVAAGGPCPPSPEDRAALAGAGRAALLAALGAPAPPRAARADRVVLELEPDDPAAGRLAAAAAALAIGGVPLLTCSRRAWPTPRPTPAPHVVAASLASAAGAAGLLLLRAGAPPGDGPARRLLLGDEPAPAGDDLPPLRLAGGDADAWAVAVLAAARAGGAA